MKRVSHKLSLNSRGLRCRLMSAFALMAVVPLLIFAQHIFPSLGPTKEPSLLLLAAIIFSLLGLSLMVNILKPISRLASGARALANGTLIPKFELRREDEIGQLGDALNSMREGLRQSVNDLKAHEEKTEKFNREIRELLERIEALSITDDLTGLYNKKYLGGRLSEEIQRAIMYQRPCSLAIFAIDHFKSYNDSYGERAGDLVLQEVAGLIRAHSTDIDKVARSGGGRFGVILPEKNKKEALLFAEEVKRVVERHRFPHERSQPGGRLTISAGVAANPIDGAKAQELLEKAVSAGNRAKEEGGNRVYGY
ncbi:diguanylate cyclase [bacterium]|nr:diguanylate cyclase [bacterium]